MELLTENNHDTHTCMSYWAENLLPCSTAFTVRYRLRFLFEFVWLCVARYDKVG